MTLQFENKHVCFPLRLGPKTLFNVGFDAAVCTTHFTEIEHLPEVGPEHGAEVVVIGSVPVTLLRKSGISIGSGTIRYVPASTPRYTTDLTSGFDTYLKAFSSKTKSTLNRKVRKFKEAAGTNEVLKEYKTPSELFEFYTAGRQLSKRTYQEKLLGTGLPDDPEFRAEMLRLGSENRVRAYTLHMKGNAVAYLYCPVRDGVLYYDRLGYDPDYADLSPGSVLQFLALEKMFAERTFKLFDFEEGEGQHKRVFATNKTQCARLLTFKVAPKSLAYVSLHYSLSAITKATLKLLSAMRVRSFARKLYR